MCTLYLCLLFCFVEHPLTEHLGLEDSDGLDLLQDGRQSWEELTHNITALYADQAMGRGLMGGERLQQTLPIVETVERSLNKYM